MQHINKWSYILFFKVLYVGFTFSFFGCQEIIKEDTNPNSSHHETNISKETKVEPKPTKVSHDTESFQAIDYPTQFFVRGSHYNTPGEKYFLEIETRLQEPAKLMVYYVETPLVFADEIVSLETPIISDGLLRSLSDCLIENQKENLIILNDKDTLAIGRFSFVAEKDIYITGAKNNWSKHEIGVPGLKKLGIYLLEVRIGPQVAHFITIVNSMKHIVRQFGQDNLVWLVDNNGTTLANIPLFFKDADGNVQQKSTNEDGIAMVPKSAWILAWDNNQIDMITTAIVHKKNTLLWTDKSAYYLKENVYCAWAPSLLSTTIKVVDISGKTMYTQAMNKECATVIALDENFLPGKYTLEIADIKKEIVVVTRKKLSLEPEIFIENYGYKVNDIIRVHVTNSNKENITLDVLDSKGKIVDQQIQKQMNNSSMFYLQIKIPGYYSLKSSGVEKKVVIIGDNIAETIPEKFLSGYGDINIFTPQSDTAALFTLEGMDYKYHVKQAGSGKWEHFSNNAQGGAFEIHTWQPKKSHQVVKVHANAAIDITIPEKIYPNEKIDAQITFSSAKDYKYLLWATTEVFDTKIQIEDVVTNKTISDARNVDFLSEKWVQKKITTDYSAAVVAQTKKQYATSAYLCQQILKWVPQHKPAQSLLNTSIQYMQSIVLDDSLSPVDRLKYSYIQGILPKMEFEDLVALIEEQANVYIEIDPAIFEKYESGTFFIEGLPGTENAFDLLSYVFATRSLTYKVEYETFFITLQSTDKSKNLLDILDQKINSEIANLATENSQYSERKLATPVFNTAFWTNWQNNSKTTISFPSSGIWTIHCIIIDKNNTTFSFVKNIWVSEKL